MGKIVLIASRKGGAGKSTIAVNVASVLASMGKTPLIVDADEQPTASEWSANRKCNYPDAPEILFRQEYGKINNILLDLADDHDYVIVDTAGHASVEMRACLTVCDILLIPFRTSMADLRTLPYMSKLVDKVREINPKIAAYAFLNVAPTNTFIKDSEPSKQLIAEYPNITLLNTVIHQRSVYLNSIADGLGVVEMNGQSQSNINARTEMVNLVKEVFSEN